VAIWNEIGIPVKYVGVGEGLDDILPFDPEEFVDALFPEDLTENVPEE
jgi:fused signal recognition particle receptor